MAAGLRDLSAARAAMNLSRVTAPVLLGCAPLHIFRSAFAPSHASRARRRLVPDRRDHLQVCREPCLFAGPREATPRPRFDCSIQQAARRSGCLWYSRGRDCCLLVGWAQGGVCRIAHAKFRQRRRRGIAGASVLPCRRCAVGRETPNPRLRGCSRLHDTEASERTILVASRGLRRNGGSS